MADSRGPRLLMDLNNAFKRDPLIDEYDILPVVEPKHNRSPFILENHKLGVEAWAVKVLLKYSANRLIGWRSRSPTEKFIDPQDICNLSRAVLLFNPDNYTAWNIRKELIDSGALTLSDDLAFGALVLSKHPKSPETFIHRRWLFQQLLDHCLSSSSGSNSSCSAPAASNEEVLVNMEGIDVDVGAHPEVGIRLNGAFALESSRLLKSQTICELQVCTQAAEKYPCNYHAWSHRIWIIKHCLNCSLQVLVSELETTRSWTSNHVSDHSGFHFRQFLLRELHNKRSRLQSSSSKDFTSLLQAEMDFIIDLIYSYPNHEAMWYHRRFIFHELLKLDPTQKRTMQQMNTTNIEPAFNIHYNEPLGTQLISQEICNVESSKKSTSNELDQLLAKNYVRWLQSL
ncbi:prenyltransferase alpha subunit repeat-containing protein 1 [Plakobranchus ocellatus]|uniref:Prenyltransferase alpha subunit repeat-containing protein 1 n=1 Tax=Plakobranchus ocellatus TaxID=259542 RepID=A0AAV4CX30_9GAST|nr:prenyltransferase alpha subunit repeat-containing protein 1 [Plakobranchus ocellatus]